jgi:hypothetical protein
MTFSPPLLLRLNGGLRDAPLDDPHAPLETVLGVQMKMRDDQELGGTYYSYTPQPTPASGLIDALVHDNEVYGRGPTSPSRPDLESIVRVDWYGTNLLDLGRLEWDLRAAYGDLFDVLDYAVLSLPRPDDPTHAIDIHRVEFAASPGHNAVPLPDAPALACCVEVELAADEERVARAVLESPIESSASAFTVRVHRVGDARARLTLEFTSPSLLDPGRFVRALEVSCRTLKVIGYSAEGDLQRDGKTVRIGQQLADGEGTLPAWRSAAAAMP